MNFSLQKAKEIGKNIGIDFDSIDLNEFKMGLSVEMEHDVDPETDVVKDDNKKYERIGKIAWAHLKEMPNYYTELKKMENKKANKLYNILKKSLKHFDTEDFIDTDDEEFRDLQRIDEKRYINPNKPPHQVYRDKDGRKFVILQGVKKYIKDEDFPNTNKVSKDMWTSFKKVYSENPMENPTNEQQIVSNYLAKKLEGYQESLQLISDRHKQFIVNITNLTNALNLDDTVSRSSLSWENIAFEAGQINEVGEEIINAINNFKNTYSIPIEIEARNTSPEYNQTENSAQFSDPLLNSESKQMWKIFRKANEDIAKWLQDFNREIGSPDDRPHYVGKIDDDNFVFVQNKRTEEEAQGKKASPGKYYIVNLTNKSRLEVPENKAMSLITEFSDNPYPANQGSERKDPMGRIYVHDPKENTSYYIGPDDIREY